MRDVSRYEYEYEYEYEYGDTTNALVPRREVAGASSTVTGTHGRRPLAPIVDGYWHPWSTGG